MRFLMKHSFSFQTWKQKKDEKQKFSFNKIYIEYIKVWTKIDNQFEEKSILGIIL